MCIFNVNQNPKFLVKYPLCNRKQLSKQSTKVVKCEALKMNIPLF